MTVYIARRLAWGLAVLVAVGLLTFVLSYVAPIDPARALLGVRATPEAVAQIRRAYGLDQPLYVQFASYVSRAVQGDFGHSYQRGTDVLPLLAERFPATLQLAIAGIALELVIGIPLGVAAARRAGGRLDRVATAVVSLLVAVPAFWLGYILLDGLAFRPKVALGLDLFPLGGYRPLDLRYLALPALTIGLTGAAYYARIVRTVMAEELRHDYVRTARAKGVSERGVAWRHAFRNTLSPVLIQLGLDAGFFLGGVVVVEQVFSWPGIGKLAVESIVTNDIPLLMGTVLFATVGIVLANLVVDVLSAVVDPRIRY